MSRYNSYAGKTLKNCKMDHELLEWHFIYLFIFQTDDLKLKEFVNADLACDIDRRKILHIRVLTLRRLRHLHY